MRNALEKQAQHLEEIAKTSKQDRVVQLAQVALQTKTDSDIRENEKTTNDHLEQINQTLDKGLNKEGQKSLNSNVVSLFKEMKKQTALTEKRLSPELAKDVTEKSMAIDQFKTIGERFNDLKTGFKDFFTLKGFFNKTGLIDANSGGIVSTALNRRSARMQYIEDRKKVDPNNVALQGLSGKERDAAAAKLYGGQFDEQQKLRRSMRENESEISRLQKAGYNDSQIKRSGLFTIREQLSAKMFDKDSRVRVAKTTDSGKTTTTTESSSFSDELALENQRSQEKVVDLLGKIEENTRKNGQPAEDKKEVKESSGGGILDKMFDFLGKGFFKAVRTIFSPKNILKAFTKVFIPAVIIGSLVNGIVDAFKAFINGGDFADVIIAGLGGVLDFLTFGLIDAKVIKNVMNWVSGFVDEYIIQPIKDFVGFLGKSFDTYIKQPILEAFNTIGDLFNEYVVTPIKNLLSPVVIFFNKLKNQVFAFLEDFGIPEISFTIPVIGKKVSIGPFYPFRPDEDTTRVATGKKLSSTSTADGELESFTNNTIATTKGKTSVLQEGEEIFNGKSNQMTSNMATFDPRTGKAYISGDAYEGEISKRAFSKIKSSAKDAGDSRAIKVIIEEDQAYQKLGFFDKLKVDTGFAKATDLLKASEAKAKVEKPELGNISDIYTKSIQNADSAAAASASKSQPVIISAPVTNNQSGSTNVTMPAPIRNEDNGYNAYRRGGVSKGSNAHVF